MNIIMKDSIDKKLIYSCVDQLESLREHCVDRSSSYDADSVWVKDAKALRMAIDILSSIANQVPTLE